MDVRFRDETLECLELDPQATGGHSEAVVTAFRKRVQFIRAAKDERDFYAWRSLHFEKLKGDRTHQYSMRLNKQWRLILELEDTAPKTVIIVNIEDYH